MASARVRWLGKIGAVHQQSNPLLLVIGFFLLAWAATRRRTSPWATGFVVLLAVAVVTRLAILSLMDVSLTTAITARYLSPLYPLVSASAALLVFGGLDALMRENPSRDVPSPRAASVPIGGEDRRGAEEDLP